MEPDQTLHFLSLPPELGQLVWQHLGGCQDLVKAVQMGMTSKAAHKLRLLGSCHVNFAHYPLGLTQYAKIASRIAANRKIAKEIVELDITGCLNDPTEQDLFLASLRSFTNLEVLRIPWHYRMKQNVTTILGLLRTKTREKLRVLDVSGLDGKALDVIPLIQLPSLTHLHIDFWTTDVVALLKTAPASLRYVSLFWTDVGRNSKITNSINNYYTHAADLVQRIRSHAKDYKFDIANLTIDTGLPQAGCETPTEATTAAGFLDECITEAKATNKMVLIQTSLYDYYTVRFAHFLQRVPILAETVKQHFVFRISRFDYNDTGEVFGKRCHTWPSLCVVDPSGEVRCIFSSGQFEASRPRSWCAYHVDILLHFLLYHRIGSYGPELPTGSIYFNASWHSLPKPLESN